MPPSDPIERLGLNVPYGWWPSAPILKEIEAAGFRFVQVPSPPPSVLTTPRQLIRHAFALSDVLATAGLRPILHGPGEVRAGTAQGDLALEGLIAYAAELGASHVVYHAANLPHESASEDARLAETRALAGIASRAERLGVIIVLENLAPVYPSKDRLSFAPLILRTMAKRISSPAVGLCLDLGARRGDFGPPELDPLRLDLHLPLGRGSVPWTRLAPLLARKRGSPLILEVHPPRPSAAHLYQAAIATVAPPLVPAPVY
jgi:sugar phosphate isomerase/epimerase